MRKHWKVWAVTILAVAVVVVLVDVIADTNIIAAPLAAVFRLIVESCAIAIRVAWEGLIRFSILIVRALQTIVPVVLRRRAWRLITMITPIGFGYAGSVFLSEMRVRSLSRLLDKYKAVKEYWKEWWTQLLLWEKLVIVALIIALQVALFPQISEYIVLFPVRFLVPVITGVFRRVYGFFTDLFLIKTYWKYCGPAHRALVRKIRAIRFVRMAHEATSLARLQYLTAWRLWKYDARYRNDAGELWVSFLEPIRLWHRRDLNKYVGRPLLAGKFDRRHFSSQQSPAT